MLVMPVWAMAGNATLTAKIDTLHVLMGKTRVVSLQLVKDKSMRGEFLCDKVDTVNAHVEIAHRPTPKVTSLGSDREQIDKQLVIQAFEPGEYSVGPFVYISGRDTLKSNVLRLRVDSIKVNEKGDIKDFAPVIKPPYKFFDWVPDFVTHLWWLWLLGAILAAATWYYYKFMRKGKNPFKREKKRLPPYEEAMQRLALLKAQQLWQNNQEKEYYTGLTDILRVYIDRRFHVNAVEMTSTQIIESLKQNPETKLVNDQLSEILAMADFVKFAGQRHLADDNERSMARAENFVEATKPVVVVAHGEEDSVAASNSETGKEAKK